MTEVSLTTAGISQVFFQFLLAVMHQDAALRQYVIHSKSVQTRQFRQPSYDVKIVYGTQKVQKPLKVTGPNPAS